jgi:hypothetical protein
MKRGGTEFVQDRFLIDPNTGEIVFTHKIIGGEGPGRGCSPLAKPPKGAEGTFGGIPHPEAPLIEDYLKTKIPDELKSEIGETGEKLRRRSPSTDSTPGPINRRFRRY